MRACTILILPLTVYFHFKQVFKLKKNKRAHVVQAFGYPFAKLHTGDSTVLAVLYRTDSCFMND